jgi:hypothetical protein
MNSRRLRVNSKRERKGYKRLERSERFDGMDGDCIEKRNRDLR